MFLGLANSKLEAAEREASLPPAEEGGSPRRDLTCEGSFFPPAESLVCCGKLNWGRRRVGLGGPISAAADCFI